MQIIRSSGWSAVVMGIAAMLPAVTPDLHAREQDDPSLTAIEQTVRRAVANSERMYRHDFDVTVESPQMNGLIEREVTGGAPLPARVDQLTLSHRNGNSRFRAKVAGLPPQFQDQVEQFLNAKLGQSNIGTMWSKATTSFLEIAREEIEKGAQFKLIRENEATQVIAVEGVDREFHKNMHLNAIRLIVSRKDALITGARLHLTDARDLTVMINYSSIEIEGEDQPLPVWSRVNIEQNSWMGTLFGFLGWPNKVDVAFSDYQFVKR